VTGEVDIKSSLPRGGCVMSGNAIFPVEENISKRLKLIYESDSRLVVERRYGLLLEEIVNMVFFLLMLILVCVVLSFVFPVLIGVLLVLMNLISENTMKQLPFILILFFFIFAFFVFYFAVPIVFQENVERVIIDKYIKTIRLEKEKAKFEKQYPIQAIKNVRVTVDSYDNITIYLDSTAESIYITGNRETYDNRKKLEIAHKLAELLGVPVIEKT
jgi:hypothetical protein